MQGEKGEHERIVLNLRMLKCKRLCHSGVMTAFSLSSHFSLLFTRSHFSFLSPFISLILSWHVPPSFYSFPLPPPSQFEIPACCLPYVNNYLLPTESNYAKRAYFFLLSYCWTFETRRIVWSPCLEALTRYNMGSMTVSNRGFGNVVGEMYRAEKTLWNCENDFFQKKFEAVYQRGF